MRGDGAPLCAAFRRTALSPLYAGRTATRHVVLRGPHIRLNTPGGTKCSFATLSVCFPLRNSSWWFEENSVGVCSSCCWKSCPSFPASCWGQSRSSCCVCVPPPHPRPRRPWLQVPSLKSQQGEGSAFPLPAPKLCMQCVPHRNLGWSRSWAWPVLSLGGA